MAMGHNGQGQETAGHFSGKVSPRAKVQKEAEINIRGKEQHSPNRSDLWRCREQNTMDAANTGLGTAGSLGCKTDNGQKMMDMTDWSGTFGWQHTRVLPVVQQMFNSVSSTQWDYSF